MIVSTTILAFKQSRCSWDIIVLGTCMKKKITKCFKSTNCDTK